MERKQEGRATAATVNAAKTRKGLPVTARHANPSRRQPQHAPRRIDIAAIARAAQPYMLALCQRWLPDGRKQGHEWVSRNPRRDDKRPGSFSVNLITGRWSDFAVGERGGDVVSLCAYLHNVSQVEAARAVAAIIGMGAGHEH